MTPFDQLAPRYAALWSQAGDGLEQRQQVWREVDELFCAGDSVLDLGCGTGDDAVHLMSRGVEVLGIDASAGMAQIARSRGVEAQQLPIESLVRLSGVYDGAISNFGALNCVADVPLVSAGLARLLKPAGLFAVCVLSRFCWRESLRFLLAGDLKKAARRWRGAARWRGITVYYRSRREWRRMFAPQFECIRSASIGSGDHLLLLFRKRP